MSGVCGVNGFRNFLPFSGQQMQLLNWKLSKHEDKMYDSKTSKFWSWTRRLSAINWHPMWQKLLPPSMMPPYIFPIVYFPVSHIQVHRVLPVFNSIEKYLSYWDFTELSHLFDVVFLPGNDVNISLCSTTGVSLCWRIGFLYIIFCHPAAYCHWKLKHLHFLKVDQVILKYLFLCTSSTSDYEEDGKLVCTCENGKGTCVNGTCRGDICFYTWVHGYEERGCFSNENYREQCFTGFERFFVQCCRENYCNVDTTPPPDIGQYPQSLQWIFKP